MKLYISYMGCGLNRELDEKLTEIVGVPRDGSGAGFGGRDIDFTIPKKDYPRINRTLQALQGDLKKMNVDLEWQRGR